MKRPGGKPRLDEVFGGLLCALALLGAAVIIWQIGGVAGHRRGVNDTELAVHTSNAKEKIERSCVKLPAAELAACAAEAVKETEEITVARSDLGAQSEMALWALITVLVATFSILLSFVGLVLVRRTLEATRESVREASASAKAAQGTYDHMREVSALELRAYVDFDKAIFEKQAGPDAAGLSDYVFSMNFVNFGKTPASKLKMKFVIGISAQRPRVLALRALPWEAVGSIAPGDHFSRNFRTRLGQQALTDITTGQTKLRVLGAATYRDHLGNFHWLPVRLESDRTLIMVVW